MDKSLNALARAVSRLKIDIDKLQDLMSLRQCERYMEQLEALFDKLDDCKPVFGERAAEELVDRVIEVRDNLNAYYVLGEILLHPERPEKFFRDDQRCLREKTATLKAQMTSCMQQLESAAR